MQTATPLQHIAATMKQRVATAPNQHAYRRLSHGLGIVYGLRQDQWRLAIGRLYPSTPSDQELKIVAQAFDAPFHFEPIRRQAKWWNPLEERSEVYNVLEITWREVPVGGAEVQP